MKHFASGLLVTLLLSMPAFSAGTDELSKAKAQVAYVYKRLTGVPASAKDIDAWGAGLVAAPDKAVYLNDVVAKAATENDKFYSVTVLNFAQPEGNKDRAVLDGTNVLNDLTATIVGLVRDEKDYRAILHDDVLYVPTNAQYAANNNTVYETLYNNVKNGAPLGSGLTAATQSGAGGTGLPVQAGIFTLRGFGSVYYEAGTNRGPFRFTAINYLCRDMEQLSDGTRADPFVRRDVDRAPGGDASKYRTECVGCHAGMDHLANAFAYYDYIPPAAPNGNAGILITPNTVAAKNNRNADVFAAGFKVETDAWKNLWTEGNNASLGWGASKQEGNGVKSLGEMLASTKMFPECMAKRVYKTVCLKEGNSPSDQAAISKLAGEFSKSFNMKELFKDAAVDCGTKIGM